MSVHIIELLILWALILDIPMLQVFVLIYIVDIVNLFVTGKGIKKLIGNVQVYIHSHILSHAFTINIC